MKISLNWLQDFVTLRETDPEAIAAVITERVAEVDDVERAGRFLRDVVVGKILTVAKHPHADRLSLCDVQTDRGTKRVVCGGTNLRPGMRVAFAHIGATVRWHGAEVMTLTKAKVRGEESEGMICAAEELDLAARFPAATGHSIIDLGDGDTDVGRPLADVLGLDDVVLHVDNHAITNRPDLFSHRGFAREFVATGLASWKKEPATPAIDFPAEPFPFGIAVERKNLVPRYEAVMLEIDALGQTPDWMRKRLEATGWRSINLPIDITNYVLMETGMPLHSFDAGDVSGDVTMRRAKARERITTLDGEERELSKGALIMEDATGIFDLLGIMGGLRGSTKETTRRIWLHSAVVDPVNTRRTVIAMGHRTDAATVYEKGVPPVAAREGLLRAVELFLQLAPGARIVSAPLSWGDDGARTSVNVRMKRLKSLLGTDVSAEQAERILGSLGCTVRVAETRIAVTPPLFRTDVRTEQDVAEEVGRIIGYNAIAPVMPASSLMPPPRDHRRDRLRDGLKEAGYTEVLPLSLTSAHLLQRVGMDPSASVTIRNPLGEETRVLQPSTLPGLLEHAQRNILHAGPFLRTFTVAHVFRKDLDDARELQQLGLLCADIEGGGDTNVLRAPFLVLKRDITDALAGLNMTVTWMKDEQPASWMHAGRAAAVAVGGTRVGRLFALPPQLRKTFDLPHRAAGAILDLSALFGAPASAALAAAVPAFPAITYDLTVPRTQQQSTAELLTRVRAASPLLERVEITDLYTDKELAPGSYHLTLRFTYRAPDRTLTEAEAKAEHAKMEAVLKQA